MSVIQSECFDAQNVISISGGKDSLAMWLLAIENEVPNMHVVFADTGHEHPQTYEYIEYLEKRLGPVQRVKADFSRQIEGKRKYIKEHWPRKLMAETPGKWKALRKTTQTTPELLQDDTRFLSGKIVGDWMWLPARKPMTEAEAMEVVSRALTTLHPTGVPFLDLCMWKGRFPSTRARFCTFDLKHDPIKHQIVEPLLDEFPEHELVSWQGVRAEESPARAKLPMWDWDEKDDVNIYRPILNWKVAEVFEIAKRHGIKPNPLYQQGCSRVGCMPCIHARKDELREIFNRFPEEIERVAQWEKLVSACSKRGNSTFFAASKDPVRAEYDNMKITTKEFGIESYSDWIMTDKARQFDLIAATNEYITCSSVYAGVCE
ncbi:phosphoadenosine phosphosulfate reductase domain-containing protein [Algicola sagamiensis]|uniref:phosphoadenosine phosphosulfate reductase domain-containing protein n=1 Tax=Algicola sagamiensis TaxID=163869 RepID=UPI000381916F|nr:phosphoadenosine phosphosulfate reductase family protein [Algicola sagamiensis]